MPSISRLRIVNFRYNDGNRLIPDEIICFADELHHTLDTLINMENGGGKSVMVQLMLQAVCPQASVQGRKISEYFRKASDHAYILLEWKLEHSADRLLTGIAIAAGQNAGLEDEKQTPVRYFTFVHSYDNSGDKNDIVNMPLSVRENGQFRPAPFEDIRKLVRSHPRIGYYHSDDLRKYRSKLEEYGILRAEWENIIVKINEVEGGVDKFFEAYQTTNSLLDKFIIPGISSRQEHSVGEDGSVETMFLNYAGSYSSQKERIQLKADITGFTEELQNLLPEVRNLWNLSDEKEKAVQQLFNYIFSVTRLLQRMETEIAEKQQCINDLTAQIQHIRLEEISEQYYRAEAIYTESTEELHALEQQCRETLAEKERCEHLRNVLLAAKEYLALKEQEQKAEALLEQIRQREAGSEDAHFLSLQYSLYCAAKEYLAHLETEHQQKAEQLAKMETACAELAQTIAELEQEKQQTAGSCSELNGKKSEISSQIDRSLESHGIRIAGSFMEDYASEEIEHARQQLDAEKTEAQAKLHGLNAEESALNAEQKSLQEKQKQYYEETAALKQDIRRNEEEMETYQAKYNAMQQVLNRISMETSVMFSDAPLRYLESEFSMQRDALKSVQRQCEQIAQQLAHAEKGQLHLPKNAVDFLEEIGAAYETGEQYLLSVDEMRKDRLLSADPLIAYAIIADSEKERARILELAEKQAEVWISAAVPVFTHADIDRMLRETVPETNTVLAAYSRPYFANAEDFTSHLTKQLRDAQDAAKQLQSQIDGIISDMETVNAFDYGAHDYETMLTVQTKLQENMQNLTEMQQADENRLNEIAARLEKLRFLCREADNSLHRAENRMESFVAVCADIERYNTVCVQYADALQKQKEVTAVLSAQQKSHHQLTEQQNALSQECSQLSDSITDCRNTLEETVDAAECDRINKPYAELKAEYMEHRKQLASDIDALHRQLEECRKKAEEHRAEIACYGVPAEEYEHTAYSSEAYRNAEQDHKKYSSQYETLVSRKAVVSANSQQAAQEMQRHQQSVLDMECEILSKTEIGSDYKNRLRRAEQQKRELEQAKRSLEKQTDAYANKLRAARKTAEKYTAEKSPAEIEVQEDMLEEITDRIQESSHKLNRAEALFSKNVSANLTKYTSQNPLFAKTVSGICEPAQNTAIAGDKYFTLYEKMEKDIQRYQSRIQQLTVELQDIAESRTQLVNHCLQRGRRVYDNLKLLANKSRVNLSGSTRQMLKITLPEIAEETESARLKMAEYIDECVDTYLNDAETMKSAEQYARKCMNLRRLLNCYIGREEIPVHVYKIDSAPQNSGYRTWERALKANSGGEKFVVLFALVLSMMNYTRGVTDSLKKTSGVLIMDNPFGPISSAHLLRPMFEIARHFRIQLICFSHLDTAEIRNCFRNIYQMKMKQLPLSSTQIVEAVPREQMEHAFYREEQMALF